MAPKPADVLAGLFENPFEDLDSGEADGGTIFFRTSLQGNPTSGGQLRPHGSFNPELPGKVPLDPAFPPGRVPHQGQLGRLPPQSQAGRQVPQGLGARAPPLAPRGTRPSGNVGKSIAQSQVPTMRVHPSQGGSAPQSRPQQPSVELANQRQNPGSGRSSTGGAGQKQRPGGNFLLVPLQNNNNNNNNRVSGSNSNNNNNNSNNNRVNGSNTNNNNNNNRPQQQPPRPENRQTTPLSPNAASSNVFRSNAAPAAPVRPTPRPGQGNARSSGVGFSPAATKDRGQPTAAPSTPPVRRVTTASTTRSFNTNSGVLRIPGHEPEAPADITVYHQDRSFNKTVVDEGIIVRDDSTSLTPEGATALILVGICIVFLVFISFVVFLKKIRQQRLEKKVVSDLDKEYKKAYSNTGYQPSNNLAPAINFLSSFGGDGGGLKGGGGFLKSPMLFAPYGDGSELDAKKQKEILATFLSIDPSATSNKLGRVWFSCYYDYVEGLLCVHILHARYIQGRSANSPKAGQVHVEASVLTPLNKILAADKTNARKATMAPVFNETLTFTVGAEEVTQFVVRLVLYHDDIDRDESRAVGSVVVPLHTLDLCSQATIFRDLQ